MLEDGFLERLFPKHCLAGLNSQEIDALRQNVLDTANDLKPVLGPKADLTPLQTMSHTFVLFQKRMLFGSHHWRARQVLSSPTGPAGNAAVMGAPSQTMKLHPRVLEPEVWICVSIRGLRLLPVSSRPAGFLRSHFAFRPTQNSDDSQLLQWGALPTFLQLVVSTTGERKVPLLITLQLDQALDVAHAIHVAAHEEEIV